MKHFKIAFISLFVCLLATNLSYAQWGSKKIKGNKQIIEETRTLSAYSELAISGSFEVELVKGTPGKINIIAESNLLEHIVTEVVKGTLTIEVARKINLNPNEKIKIIVHFDELNEISMSGSGNINSKNTIEAKNLTIKQSGSGQMNLVLDISRTLDISKSGSGNIQLQGNAKNLELRSSGSGNLACQKLVVNQADIKLSGSGNIYITCEEDLQAKVSGSGNVKYKGNPSKRDIKVSGSGKVERL